MLSTLQTFDLLIATACDGCGAEINRRNQRFGCRRCWEMLRKTNATYCRACAMNHPDHRSPPPSFEVVTLSMASGKDLDRLGLLLNMPEPRSL